MASDLEGLDEATANDLHRLLRDMHAEHGLTSIIVTHNPLLAATCDRERFAAPQLLRDMAVDGRTFYGANRQVPPATDR